MKLFFTLFAALFCNCIFCQYSLPEVSTTEQKSLTDLAKGIPNENWFKKAHTGYDTYCIIFKNTPVGIKHAYDKYYELRKEYQTNDCENGSMMSSLCYKEDKSIDYEMLSITIKTESSEIKYTCKIEDTRIKNLKFISAGGSTGFIMIFITVLSK